jgi:hypothetical protein
MSKRYPEEQDSEPAMEGTAAHWVIETLYEGEAPVVGAVAPNGIAVTDEMIEGAELFMERIIEHGIPGVIEHKLTMFTVIHPENWGRPDFSAFNSKSIAVLDYKFGFGYVDAFENWQCINYVAGVVEQHKIDLKSSASKKIEVVIEVVQPRCYTREGPVRTWKTTLGELVPYFERLKLAARIASEPEPTASPGEHCEFCRGRHACEALQMESMSGADWAYEVVPHEIPVNAAARELIHTTRAFKLMEARMTGLQEMLLAKLRNGEQVPGFQIEQGQGRQRWTRPVEEVISLGSMFNLQLAKPGVVTPKQAIKLGVPQNVVDTITELPVGEWKLVEVDLRKSRKIFG